MDDENFEEWNGNVVEISELLEKFLVLKIIKVMILEI